MLLAVDLRKAIHPVQHKVVFYGLGRRLRDWLNIVRCGSEL